MPRKLNVTRQLARDLIVAGVDEAGRGPLAGPVVVSAVILDPERPIRGLNDSKQLDEATREKLYGRIVERALAWTVIFVEREEIDRINIFQATMVGMTRSLMGLSLAPQMALIDGNRLPRTLPCEARAVIGGDATEPAISAASILAKVSRDRHMQALDAVHPGYGFARHKGYAVPEHIEALDRLGPCHAHRRTFAPVKRWFEPATPVGDLFETALS
ncbi:ribonuclease HII [Luteibacter aegosomatis]|uniref:ribonuclease HII n=1 Tax=Luteibacter aegosomatis TaxID=2911537 RepID=UPI001FFB2F69|nr:ribonuclease HII [Luteibacter aegosomatis]UPG86757.1 ribonuclease HII [Luteibacter aegosomatis]